jgi:hypothetical protein
LDYLLSQVNTAIDIFKPKINRWVQALFMFNNALSHQKYPLDALFAWQMVKGMPPPLNVSSHQCLTIFTVPKKDWVHHPGRPQMQPGMLPVGLLQPTVMYHI